MSRPGKNAEPDFLLCRQGAKMSDFIFKINPYVIMGSYNAGRLGEYAKEWGSRFMIIVDPILSGEKFTEKVLAPFNDHKIENFVFSEINDGTSTKTIERALKLAKEAHVNGIIAIGGEKSMHVGRAVAALFNEDADIYSFMDGKSPEKQALPCLCVPTTFRTPFVFTQDVPVTDARNRTLKLLKVQNSLCKLVVYDPTLMLSLTENQKAMLSIEILGLAIEAYISQKANFFSDMFVEKGMEILSYALDGSPSLDITTSEEDLLAQAGAMISMATSSASIGLGTIISQGIYSKFKINKSLTESVLLPFMLEDAIKFKADKLAKLAHAVRACSNEATEEEAAKSLIDFAREKIAKANLPTRLKDLNLKIEQLSIVVEDISKLHYMSTLPKSFSTDELFSFIKDAF